MDTINHPLHYTSHPSGVECIEIAEHLGFNLGNAFKYLFRRNNKGEYLENLKKALWYINREHYSQILDRSQLPILVYYNLGKVVASEDGEIGKILANLVFGYNNYTMLCQAKNLLEKEIANNE